MGALFSVEVTGEEAVAQGLVAITEKINNLTPFWVNVFAPKYYASVQDLFATGGRARGGGGKFKGGAWAPLSKNYRAWKQQHYPGQPTLVREGDLRESMRWSGNAPGPGGIFRAMKDAAIVGTAVPYAKFHHFGTKKMPARQFLIPADPSVFAPLLQQWLLGKTK